MINIFYLEKLNYLDQALYYCKKFNLKLCYRGDSFEYCNLIELINPPNNLLFFLVWVRLKKFNKVYIFSDEISPYAQYIAKYNNTTCIPLDTFFKGYKYYKNKHGIDLIPNKIQKFFYHYQKFYDRKISPYDFDFYTLIKFNLFTIISNFSFKTSLPGYFSTNVIVDSIEIYNVYIDNFYPSHKIEINQNIYIDFLRELKIIKTTKKRKITLISQPFYLYKNCNWAEEFIFLYEECKKENVELEVLLHPRDNIEFYNDYADLKIIKELRSLKSTLNIISDSLFIVVKSTTMIDIFKVLKLPLLYLDYIDYDDFNGNSYRNNTNNKLLRKKNDLNNFLNE